MMEREEVKKVDLIVNTAANVQRFQKTAKLKKKQTKVLIAISSVIEEESEEDAEGKTPKVGLMINKKKSSSSIKQIFDVIGSSAKNFIEQTEKPIAYKNPGPPFERSSQ